MLSVIFLCGLAQASPRSAVAFSFDPHFANLTAHDEALRAYGFAPVGRRFLPMYGVRGRFFYDSGVSVGLVAEFGFGSQSAADNPVPTTTSWTKIGSIVGWSPGPPLQLEADIGFGALSHSIGSTEQGGALLYLGPYIHPRLTVIPVWSPTFLELGVGWLLQLPLSPPHQQPLWEEPFRHRVVQGPSVAITVGMGGS